MRKTLQKWAVLDIEEFPSLQAAEAECPWACAIEEVEGGWVAFESATDWETWLNQV